MSSYENVFLNHIQLDKRISGSDIENSVKKSDIKDRNLQKHEVRNRILRKYRRNWWKFYSVRKKKTAETSTFTETPRVQSDPSDFRLSRSWPSLGTKDNAGNTLFPETNHDDKILFRGKSLDSAEIQNGPFCTEFPIAEIGTEMSGNRGNGNSPFNSSNSCGSPEGLFSMETNQKSTVSSKVDEKEADSRLCTKCFRELNNNLEHIKSNPSKEVCACGDDAAAQVEGQHEKSNFSNVVEKDQDDQDDLSDMDD
ncbi:hypothetical protein FSP39_024320 [Pinctada imbricata]|uniref:Uncharacterized protein n=1 Tax=Pinctada imbricata TaxID=66713 RepID=A0AA88Y1I3_PINIB|nr:hypothetical protein FSP39_024320 [Pinctada imbricata]